MVVLKINKKEYFCKYTFHSMRLIKDIEIGNMDKFQDSPLGMIAMLSDLFYGGMNWSAKKEFSRQTCDELLEEYLAEEDSDFMKLFEDLLNELQDSEFFKALQRKNSPQEKLEKAVPTKVKRTTKQ